MLLQECDEFLQLSSTFKSGDYQKLYYLGLAVPGFLGFFLSFTCLLYLSLALLLDLDPQRLFVPIMAFITKLKGTSLPLFKQLLLPRFLTSTEALGPSRAKKSSAGFQLAIPILLPHCLACQC